MKIVSAELELTDEDIEDIIDMASYGIGYWAVEAVVDREAHTYTIITADDEDTQHVVTDQDIRKATNAIAGGGLTNEHIQGYLLAGDMGGVDSDVADCIIQVAIFGKIVYG